MAGARGQPERQIAGRRSDRQCNYAEPLQRQQREGPARPAQCTGFPPSLAGLSSPRAPKSPRPKWGKAGRRRSPGERAEEEVPG